MADTRYLPKSQESEESPMSILALQIRQTVEKCFLFCLRFPGSPALLVDADGHGHQRWSFVEVSETRVISGQIIESRERVSSAAQAATVEVVDA